MADEATVLCGLSYTKGNMPSPITVGGTPRSVTVSGTTPVHQVISVATTQQALDMGEITGAVFPCYLYIKNLDATNFVKLRAAVAGSYIAKLTAGQEALIPLDATVVAPYIVADTAACLVEYLLLPV